MKNRLKFAFVSLFGLMGLLIFLSGVDHPSASSAEPSATPTPQKTNVNAPANTPAPANTTKVNTATPPVAPAGGKEIREKFTLSQGSEDPEGGPVPFNHKTHATMNYSPDGKSVIACVECHHTDQPKSALKPPLVTSERDVVLTLDTWKSSNQKVNECRSCHLQKTVADAEGKTIPTAQYTERGKTVTKDLDNRLAYHINCNTCHDSAAKLRSNLLSKPGFAIGSDCKACHSGGN